MLFCEGRHLVGNAFADHRGDACVADAQAEEVRAIAVFSAAPGVIPVAMGAALDKELPPMSGRGGGLGRRDRPRHFCAGDTAHAESANDGEHRDDRCDEERMLLGVSSHRMG